MAKGKKAAKPPEEDVVKEVKDTTPELEKNEEIKVENNTSESEKKTDESEVELVEDATESPPDLSEQKDNSPAEEGLEKKKGLFGRFRKKEDTKVSKTEKTKEKSTEEAAEELYKHIAEIKGQDYWVFRVRKRTVLVVLGLILLVMWGVALVRWYQGGKSGDSTPTVEETVEVTSLPAPTIEAEEDGLIIRVRNNSDLEGGAEVLGVYLREQGYDLVDVVDDFDSEYSGVSVVVKSNAAEVREEIESLLEDKYELSSPSAELTDDSDFDAVILFGIKTEDNE